MKTKRILFVIFALLLLGIMIISAQTNEPASVAPMAPDTTLADIGKVLSDFGFHVNLSSAGGILFLLYYVAKWIRNKTSIGQTGFGRILAGVLNAEAGQPAAKPANSASGPATAIIAIFCLFSFGAGAQQFQLPAISLDKWTVIGGYGQSFSGSKQIAFGDLAYNFNRNVGIVIGADQLWAPGQRQANVVKGGVTLSATIHPFAFIGSTMLTNVIGTPFISDLLSTPKGGHSTIGNVTTAGINFDIIPVKNLEIVSGFQVEKRIGQGFWDDKYWLAHVGLSRRF